MFCVFVCVMLYMMVLAKRVGTETQLQRVTAGWWNQWCTNVEHWSSGVIMFWTVKSPPTVSSYMTSRLCHVWLCDVASPIPSWHRLRRENVTFRDATSLAANWCLTSLLAANLFTYLLWLLYMFSFAFWSILVVDRRRKISNFPVGCMCVSGYTG